jgi:hypothetical protein
MPTKLQDLACLMARQLRLIRWIAQAPYSCS